MIIKNISEKKNGSLSEYTFARVRFGSKPLPNKPISEKVNEAGQEMLRKYPSSVNKW